MPQPPGAEARLTLALRQAEQTCRMSFPDAADEIVRLQGCEINCSGKSGKDPGQRRGMQVDSGERRMLAEEPQVPGLMD